MTGEPLERFDLDEFRDSGMLYLANRTLHVFGLALAVMRDDEGKAVELYVVETGDPLGLTFAEDQEDEARTRLFAWLRSRLAR